MRLYLAHNVKIAIIRPFRDNTHAQGWMFAFEFPGTREATVEFQLMGAVGNIIEELYESLLSPFRFSQKGLHWNAARLYAMLGGGYCGLSRAEQTDYFRRCVRASENVEGAGALDFRVFLSWAHPAKK
jgi:hypothetical protein